MYDLQKSSTSTLPLGQGPSQVLTENGETYLAFHHTRTDKGCNLRAYVPAVTGSLQCSMDKQSSDGKAMLLKYVTSYVAKCHDVVTTQQLYSEDLCAYQAARSFLKRCVLVKLCCVLQIPGCVSMKLCCVSIILCCVSMTLCCVSIILSSVWIIMCCASTIPCCVSITVFCVQIILCCV